METTILRLPAVLAATGLSRSTLYELIATGAFPRQVRLSARSVGWPEGEVRAWLLDRMLSRAKQ